MTYTESKSNRPCGQVKNTRVMRVFKQCKKKHKKTPFPCQHQGGKKKVTCFMIFERPGPVTKESRFVCPENDDPTAWFTRDLFEKSEICREDVFIANACLWRPRGKKNKEPTKGEIEKSGKYLQDLYREVQPKVIATVGKAALLSLLRKRNKNSLLKKVPKWEGKKLTDLTLDKVGKGQSFKATDFQGTEVTVVCLYHPSCKGLLSRWPYEQLEDWEYLRQVIYPSPKKRSIR